jgi:single-strand DNA-binding protein
MRETKIYIMNNLRNKVQLIGFLGLTPEIISFENGNKLAKLRLATNDNYTNNKGEKVTETQWHSLVAWGKQADIIEKFISKGQEIAIEGKLATRSYETKEGEKRYRTEVVVTEILMLGSKESNTEEDGTAS